MPELPEVETVRLQLRHKIVGKTIKSVRVHHPKSAGHNSLLPTQLIGNTVCDIDRIGKLLIISFTDEPDLYLLIHLKMTGQLFFVETDGAIVGGGHSMSVNDSKQLPNRHTRISFFFNDGSALHFNDMRLFGYAKIANKNELDTIITTYGPEPTDKKFDINWFVAALRKRTGRIKAVLLDQTFVAGLGNIYVDETLYQAGVLPTRRADRVTATEARAIAKAAGAIMRRSIAAGGTTFQHFVDVKGDKGNYTKQLRVFGKQNTPCPRCGSIILKTKVAGRGTHYCPTCQT